MHIDFKSFHYRAPKSISGFPVGTRVYKGFQGSGKTLSMVHYCLKMLEKYPSCLCYSNVAIDHARVLLFSTNDELEKILQVKNGASGVLILLDEAHLFFNKKRGISLDFLAAISQQRKNRMHIVMSSQIWEELDISLRKQVKEIVSCRSLFRTIIINEVADGETLTYDKQQGAYVAKKKYTYIFHMTRREAEMYDTLQTISRNDEYIQNSFNPLNVTVQAQNDKPRFRHKR